MIELRVEVAPEMITRVESVLFEHELPNWHIDELREPVVQAWLKGVFPDKPAARAAWKALRGALPARVSALKPDLRTLREQNWRESYKAHFRRWQFAGLHWVPEWERAAFRVPEGEAVVYLDPGLAFGTGNHETTRLCVERLVEFAIARREAGADLGSLSVIDAGCGSGILAISARKLGLGRVFGFDNDPIAIESSIANSRMNGLEQEVEFAQADIVEGLGRRKADLVLANIQADVLIQNRDLLRKAVKPGGRLVLSGILVAEVALVEAAFAASGVTIRAHPAGEWTDLVLDFPAAAEAALPRPAAASRPAVAQRPARKPAPKPARPAARPPARGNARTHARAAAGS